MSIYGLKQVKLEWSAIKWWLNDIRKKTYPDAETPRCPFGRAGSNVGTTGGHFDRPASSVDTPHISSGPVKMASEGSLQHLCTTHISSGLKMASEGSLYQGYSSPAGYR